jgi:plastocyanin
MLALAPVAVAMALPGCGSSSSSSTTSSASAPTSAPAALATSSSSSSTPAPAASSEAGGQTLKLASDPAGQLKFDASSLTAKAGKVTIDFTNTASLSHNVTVVSAPGSVVGETPTFEGGSKTLSLNLKPGTYKFYCSVPGHRQAGMEGTLTVQ